MIYTCPSTEQTMFIQKDTCENIINNDEMVANHGAEVFADPVHADMNFNINKDYYRQLEESGMLLSYTVRKQYAAEFVIGELIGYMMFVVLPCHHFTGTMQAHNDAIYLEPEYRASSFGKQMITYAQDDLKKLGVDVLYLMPPHNRDWSPVLDRMGYHNTEQIYARRL